MSVEAINRAVEILTVLSDSGPRGETLRRLSNGLGLHKSTAHRALATLRARNYVVQNPDGSYALGPAAIALGHRYQANS